MTCVPACVQTLDLGFECRSYVKDLLRYFAWQEGRVVNGSMV